jgi:hypothetical protein
MALRPDDIRGQRIVAVLQDQTDADPDGFSACSVFVELANGVLFALDPPDIQESELKALCRDELSRLTPAEIGGSDDTCVGDTIRDVVRSDFWASIGLILDSGRFLYMSDHCSWHHVGACCTRIGERYGMDGVSSFWDK